MCPAFSMTITEMCESGALSCSLSPTIRPRCRILLRHRNQQTESAARGFQGDGLHQHRWREDESRHRIRRHQCGAGSGAGAFRHHRPYPHPAAHLPGNDAWVKALAHGLPVSQWPENKDEGFEFTDGKTTEFPYYRLIWIGQDGVGDAAHYRIEAGYRVKVSNQGDSTKNRSDAEGEDQTFTFFQDPKTGKVFYEARRSPRPVPRIRLMSPSRSRCPIRQRPPSHSRSPTDIDSSRIGF